MVSIPNQPTLLEGASVRLEPLQHSHCRALQDAVQDGQLWQVWCTVVPKPEGMAQEIERRLKLQAAGSMLPYVVVRVADNTVVGMTTYMNIDRSVPRVEVGSTWYAASAQRTGVNTAAKTLLLTHAFESMGCHCVEFRTHFLNQKSRKAIERLGAKLDGILRSHTRMPDGSLRDTCVYSIVAAEWPAVKMHLLHGLKR